MSNYFVEKLKAPSAAIQAMVDGLREIPDETFRVDMDHFLQSDGDICYGCAATCAVQQIEQSRYKPEMPAYGWTGRSKHLNVPEKDLFDFERAIDHFRLGSISELFFLFGVDDYPDATLPCLHSDDYQEHLGVYEDYANQLREIGL